MRNETLFNWYSICEQMIYDDTEDIQPEMIEAMQPVSELKKFIIDKMLIFVCLEQSESSS